MLQVGVSLLFLCGASSLATESKVTREQLDAAIDAAGDYLVRQVRANGQFVYRVNTNPTVRVPPKYNMLRHAGAMVALAEYARFRPRPEIRQALAKTAGFLQSQIDTVLDVPEVAAVWSDPVVHRGTGSREAKLGGTGLGLVVLCQLEGLDPGSTSAETLVWMGNFLLFMQREDGGFFSIYRPGFPGRDDRWTSLYYPGEASLGLLLLDEVHPDEAWATAASEALCYLARTRQGAKEVPADHWALIATARLLSRRDPTPFAVERPLLISHAQQIVRQMLREQAPQHGQGRLDGCFSHDGRTTPTATRLEGLLATLTLMEGDPPLHAQMEMACQRGLFFLLRAQIKAGAFVGGVPRAMALPANDHPAGTPSFQERASEIRIDYVQHVLSAMLAYRGCFYPTATHE